jgi:hypothetical protein
MRSQQSPARIPRLPESVLAERRWVTLSLGVASLAILVLACFGGAILRDGQFAFRDAARFYYPLYHRIQEQWSTGQVPLWEPGENGGRPLLGNPMAAVLYPGKVIFTLVPYPWGMRFYVVAHVLLAFGAMLSLARSLGISLPSAVLAGLCYAFGGPVLSDYFNVIYLVGAAWLPLGFEAVDSWLRFGRRPALIKLTLVLSMQILGGDPQSAYLTVVFALGYGVALANRPGTSSWLWPSLLALPAGAIAWIWVGPTLVSTIHGPSAWVGQFGLIAAWMIGTLAYLITRSREHRIRLATSLVGIAGASLLAITLTAVQVLPAVDNIRNSVRWSGTVPIYLYDLSVLPYRALECVWPNVFGTFTAGNHYWMSLLPPADAHRASSLTLYLGTLPLLLALSAAGFRNGPAWRGAMTALALLSFWASLGEFAGASRWSHAEPFPTDGDESFYGFLAAILPGMHLFRLPYKLLVFTNLALAVLAAHGWDGLLAGTNRRRVTAVTIGLLGMTALTLAVATVWRFRLLALFTASPQSGSIVFGPLDAHGALADLIRGLLHGVVAVGFSLALVVWSEHSPIQAGWIAIPFVAVDLALANSAWVVCVPQRDFEQVPAVLRAISAAERAESSSAPVRVHRLNSWVPIGWSATASPQRLRELVNWELNTLQPGLGLLHGIRYVLSDESETGRADYRRFFEPVSKAVSTQDAAVFGLEAGHQVLYYPRLAFDLWGARYFILPSFPADWNIGNRGYAAFLDQTELIYPDPATLEGPEHAEDRKNWLKSEDVQVRRNKRAFPRTWIVHKGRIIRTLFAADTRARDALCARLGFSADSSTANSLMPAPDLRSLTFIETDHPEKLRDYLPGINAGEDEIVKVRSENPTRVVLEAQLSRPGLVILADVFDDDWRLTVDGQPAAILRANLLMRAAAVNSGVHTLVYTYEPASVRIGTWLSATGLAVLVSVAVGARVRPVASGVP